MSAVTTLPRVERGGPFTQADRDAMPDDGCRYDLVDGALIVTPAPIVAHQRVVSRLVVLLTAAVPPDAEVFPAPFDVALLPGVVVQPDVVVARRSDLTIENLPGPPLLAVEILSPSSRRLDRGLRCDLHQEAGTPAYWVVDPHEVRLQAWDLRDGAYVQVADVCGDEPFHGTVPFAVTVVPSALVAG
jgi:Uma2 family endonuclease